MKQLLLVLALATGSLIACNDDSGSGSSGDGKDSSNSNVYRQIIKGIETGDSALLSKYISSDATAHGANPDGTDLRGDSLIVRLSELKNDVKNLKLEVVEEAGNKDHLFTLVRTTGTNPEGGKMDSRTVEVVKIKNGKAIEFWNYIEHSQVMRAMSAEEDDSNNP